MSNAIDRLEASGLVERLPHPSDGRTTLARITPAGRRLARKAAAVWASSARSRGDVPARAKAISNERRRGFGFME